MRGLPDALKIPDGPEKLSIPLTSLPVSSLIKFQLPPQRKSTVFADPTEYISESTSLSIDSLLHRQAGFEPNLRAASHRYHFQCHGHSGASLRIVKALGRAILADPEAKSILLAIAIHSGWPQSGRQWSAYATQELWRTAVDQVQETLEKSTTSEAIAGRANAALKALEFWKHANDKNEDLDVPGMGI
ncbi:hypothetical protein B0H13DRAFT_1854673 [Mycena leptocephala]|nr:hypothetical protein B0H13DRAFT_1854673 [Mycena leptocephala]